jgi:hypothetical protein
MNNCVTGLRVQFLRVRIPPIRSRALISSYAPPATEAEAREDAARWSPESHQFERPAS